MLTDCNLDERILILDKSVAAKFSAITHYLSELTNRAEPQLAGIAATSGKRISLTYEPYRQE